MALTDTVFLFLFFPISLIICFLGHRLQKYFLLLLSLFFYACGSPKYVFLFLILLVIDIACAYYIQTLRRRGMKKAMKVLLAAAIVLNIGLLFYYKYYDFTVSNLDRFFGTSFAVKNLMLPMGISFFSFKAISLLVDVYRGETVLKKDPSYAALYLSFYGQIISGPIAGYDEFYENYTPENLSIKKFIERFSDGGFLFVRGYVKKILLANILSLIVNEAFAGFETSSASLLWLGSVCFSLQLYYDFSGYSDMAIGIGRIFGIGCKKNFDYPYITASVSEFWRRWHISLGTWFRKYVYFPLGGSRVRRKSRLYFNLFVVWAATGIWHGANWTFIAWGMFYFIVIAFEKAAGLPGRLKSPVSRAIYRVPVLMFINFQWVLFNSSGLKAGLKYIRNMFTAVNPLSDVRTIVLLRQYGIFIAAAVIFAIPVIPKLKEYAAKKSAAAGAVVQVILGAVLCALFVVSVSFVIAGNNDPFLYGNF